MAEQSPETPVNKFRVVSIEKTTPPESVSGGEWYRYVIQHNATTLNGLRSGTLNSVAEYLDDYVEKLNARPYWGYSTYATRNVKK
jgi:hypothetical protein